MQKWEYLWRSSWFVETPKGAKEMWRPDPDGKQLDFPSGIEELGLSGWELAGSTAATFRVGHAGMEHHTLIFKRPLED